MPDYPGQMSFDDMRPEYERDAGYTYGARARSPGSSDGAKLWLFGVAAASFLGAIFAAISTSDFVQHLDRQVHSIHCSIVPGAGAGFGDSGCRTVMMSPYSSLFRESFWGGIPISLLALAVFAYLVARALSFALADGISRRETGYLVLATCLPALMSLLYGVISAVQIGELCTNCVGVYLSSALALGLAFVAHAKAPASPTHDNLGTYFGWFFVGVGYVALLVVLYVGLAPSEKDPAKGCGTLVKRSDPSGVILSLGGKPGGTKALAVLDPLCPACRAFDGRLHASSVVDELKLEAVLFPLDSTCNWMVKESLHPGACAVSEAMLCASDEAPAILAWAFENQEALLEEAKADERKLRRRIAERFPAVKSCLGSPKARNKVNKSLRFAVANALPVLTPQLFVGDRRVCDEDTDLGLEYTVRRMIEAEAKQGGKR